MKQNSLPFRQQQLEKLQELGSRLREFRQNQAVSLDEIAAKTRIQARLLNAIEEAKLDILPEPVYIQGLIKRFADALGLNGDEFSKTFPTETGFVLIRPSWLHVPAGQLRPIHLYMLYIFLVFCSVNGLSYVVNQSALQAGKAQSSATPTAKAQSKTQLAQELEPSNSLKATNVSNVDKQVRVGVKLESSSWIRVTADGKTKFEGVLQEGDQRTWEANQELTVRAENAGSVLVAVNDQKAKKLGPPGAAQEVTFAANTKS
jgi:cytoskeletal protein RodZ